MANQAAVSVQMAVPMATVSNQSVLRAPVAIGLTLSLPPCNVRPNLKPPNAGVRAVNAELMSNAEANIGTAPELPPIAELAIWSGVTGPS